MKNEVWILRDTADSMYWVFSSHKKAFLYAIQWFDHPVFIETYKNSDKTFFMYTCETEKHEPFVISIVKRYTDDEISF